MRKRIVRQPAIQSEPVSAETWINLEQIVTVQVTSEDPDFPIESVFDGNSQVGWRALEKGKQQIQLIFDQPMFSSSLIQWAYLTVVTLPVMCTVLPLNKIGERSRFLSLLPQSRKRPPQLRSKKPR